jgi:hypothetical protein
MVGGGVIDSIAWNEMEDQMRTNRTLGVVLGALVLSLPLSVSAEKISAVESKAGSDGSWTAFSFPKQIPENAKIKVIEAKCEKPKIEDVQFALAPKGKCAGPAGSLPKGATKQAKLDGVLYKLSEMDLCAATSAAELKCLMYADTEW